jgi:5-formyltetrahydrofolate cyclo-ligase
MDWPEVRAWRRGTRERLIGYRSSLPRDRREEIRQVVIESLRRQIPGLATARIGFYFPYKGEIDLRPLLRQLVARGAEAALPAIVEKAHPVEFRAWHPGVEMERGAWDIPVPKPGNPVRPGLLLAPLVGFDAAGYRLGHGGGYYDRTLATFAPKPLTIGVGYEATRLDTIHPQPHDIPMDAIVTEEGVTWHERETADGDGFASPACSMHEVDPAYMGLTRRP